MSAFCPCSTSPTLVRHRGHAWYSSNMTLPECNSVKRGSSNSSPHASHMVFSSFVDWLMFLSTFRPSVQFVLSHILTFNKPFPQPVQQKNTEKNQQTKFTIQHKFKSFMPARWNWLLITKPFLLSTQSLRKRYHNKWRNKHRCTNKRRIQA